MDKISGIIKNSARVQAVDLKDASPIRPGAPGFGRPEGNSSLAKLSLPVLALASPIEAPTVEAVDPVMNWKTKDQKNAVIAAELTSKFFAKPLTLQEAIKPIAVDDLPMMKTDRLSDRSSDRLTDNFRSTGRNANFNELPDMGPVMMQPDGYFPRGSFIDRIG